MTTSKRGALTQGQTLRGYVPGDDPLQAQHDRMLIEMVKQPIPPEKLLVNRGALNTPPPPEENEDDGGGFLHGYRPPRKG